MSSITRWDPMREVTSLHDAMSQLLEQAVLRPGYLPFGAQPGTGVGQMDVLEADGRYFCSMALPGVGTSDIDVTVRQNTLTVRARHSEPFTEELRKKGTYLLRELGTGEFSRSVTFPKDVDGDAIEARYERGILLLEIPVAQHAQPKRITIRGADSAQRQVIESAKDEPRTQEPQTATANGRTSSVAR